MTECESNDGVMKSVSRQGKEEKKRRREKGSRQDRSA